MVYTFNELSVTAVGTREQVCNVMETFVKTHVEATRIGFQQMRLHEQVVPDIYSFNLSNDYNIDNWLQDSRVSSDLRDKFRLISTTSPLVMETDTEENDHYTRSEFFKLLDGNDHQVWGLGAAYLYDTISISLATREEWLNAKVDINHYYLDDDTVEQNQLRSVRHFANSNTLYENIEWFHVWQREQLEKSADLWAKKDEFFPGLSFLNGVEKQFQILGDTNLLTRIVNALQKFDSYVAHWEEGGFSYEDAAAKTQLRISPESDTTIRLYGAQRKFMIPEVGKRLFDLHIKLGGTTRIHFYPDNQTKKVYVGYVGKHMRISSED